MYVIYVLLEKIPDTLYICGASILYKNDTVTFNRFNVPYSMMFVLGLNCHTFVVVHVLYKSGVIYNQMVPQQGLVYTISGALGISTFPGYVGGITLQHTKSQRTNNVFNMIYLTLVQPYTTCVVSGLSWKNFY